MKLSPFKAPATLAAVLMALSLGQAAQAESFGINFLGNATAQTVTGAAGVEPNSGWNNINQGTFTSGSILSSDGSHSVTLTMSGSGRTLGWNNGSTADGGDGSLMRGYNDAGINNPTTNVISGLTNASYTVYLYTQGDTARPSNGGDWQPNYTVNATRFYTSTLGGAFGGYSAGGIALTNTHVYPSPIVSGNYLQIQGVTPVSGAITISANSDNQSWRSPLNAIQLVAETVAVAPGITAQTSSLTNYAGATVQLSVVASGTPLYYQWQAAAIGSSSYTNLNNGPGISGATNSILTLSNATVANSADYIVVITNSAGSASSPTPTTVQIVTLFLAGATPSASVVYPAATVHFSVSASGTAPLSYHWRKNGSALSDGGNVSGAGTNLLTLSNVSAAEAASYDVVVTNVYGAVTSSVGTLGLTAAPAAGSYAQNLVAKGPVAYWRFNESAGPSAYDFVGGHAGQYGNDALPGIAGGLTSPTWPAFESTNTSFGTQPNLLDSTVQVPAGAGLNLNTNTVTIVGWFYPTSALTPNAGLVLQRDASGVAGLILGNNGNLGYNWNDDSFTWSYDSGLSLPLNQWSFVAMVLTPTNVTFYLDNTSGEGSAVFVHNHANAPFSGLMTLGADPVFGDGSRVFTGFIDEVAVFNRSLSNAEVTQLYSLASGSLVAPGVTVQPQSQAVLAGANVPFSVTAAGSEPLHYQWQKNGADLPNGGNVSGVNTASLGLTNVTVNQSGDYTVVITNAAGAVTSSIASLTVVVPTNYVPGLLGLLPAGYWPLNETSGTTAADASGNGLDGTYQAAVTLGVPGVANPPYLGFEASNRAAAFDGQANSWVTLPGLNLNSANATFLAWIYPTNATQPGAAGLIYCRDGVGTASGFGFNPAGTQLGYTWNDDGGTYGWNSGLRPPLNQWSLVALVITPTNATIYLYNTNSLTSAQVPHTHAPSAFSGETRIGNDCDNARTFQGSIDESAVFNSSLSFGQIQQLYMDGSLGNPIPPVVLLSIQRSGNNLLLSWPQGTLLEATNVSGPWLTNAVGTTTATVSPTNAHKFFRVQVR